MTTLQEWGYKVKIGKTVGGNSQTYFSGTDEERLDDFQEMLDDDDSESSSLCPGWLWYRQNYRTNRFQ